MSTLHPNNKFTTDVESDNVINFLDPTIIRINNKHEFSIFHNASHPYITKLNSL